MNPTHNGSLNKQSLLGSILDQVPETSPISAFSREIEQKYLFASGSDREESCKKAEDQISVLLHGKGVAVIPFEGVDYCFNVIKKGKLHSFRYRTGLPLSHRMGLKIRHKNKKNVRDEIEFDVREGTELSKVLSYLRFIAQLGESFSEKHIKVKGNIRYIPLNDGTNRKIELVVFLGKNLVTEKTVSVAEIEAHGFEEIDTAQKEIFRYEKLLGWKPFRTLKSMSQLLD